MTTVWKVLASSENPEEVPLVLLFFDKDLAEAKCRNLMYAYDCNQDVAVIHLDVQSGVDPTDGSIDFEPVDTYFSSVFLQRYPQVLLPGWESANQ
jgi:hypothetical protein